MFCNFINQTKINPEYNQQINIKYDHDNVCEKLYPTLSPRHQTSTKEKM